MLQKLQNDNDDLMEIFQQHYAELRREHSEFKDTAHKLECEVAGLRGRIEQLGGVNPFRRPFATRMPAKADRCKTN